MEVDKDVLEQLRYRGDGGGGHGLGSEMVRCEDVLDQRGLDQSSSSHDVDASASPKRKKKMPKWNYEVMTLSALWQELSALLLKHGRLERVKAASN